VRCVFKEERWRDLENVGRLLQATCPNPVSAVFVVLYLLEGEAERTRELSLAYA
jgi:hypothetical protein